MTDYSRITDNIRAARRAATTDAEKAWLKIRLNSELPLVAGPAVAYNPDVATKVTETGQKLVREMMEKLGDQAADQESVLSIRNLPR